MQGHEGQAVVSSRGRGGGLKLYLLPVPGGRGGAAKARERIEEAVAQQHSIRERRQWQWHGRGNGRGKGNASTSLELVDHQTVTCSPRDSWKFGHTRRVTYTRSKLKGMRKWEIGNEEIGNEGTSAAS